MTKNKTSVLIIDDDEDILTACRLLLKKYFDRVVTTNKPEFIPQLMEKEIFHAILLDMNFRTGDNTGREGLQWLGRILQIDPQAVVLLFTAFSSVDAAVEAMKMGAADFIEKPWNNEKLVTTMKAAVRLRNAQDQASKLKVQNRVLSEEIQRLHHPMIGDSEALQNVMKIVRKVAPTDANILILGENGTGKELIAREIHAFSNRKEEVFVSVDLVAIPETLFESELFGHKKGAFTDAREDRVGRFQAAEGGTLFLDEIGNLPLNLQPKLLAALESRSVVPVGSTRAVPIDVRLISATNVSPEKMKDNTVFRPDLLYRLNTVEIHLPPLRERIEDIPLLADAFLAQYARKYNRPTHGLTSGALKAMTGYSWPGNIRELRHSIERAVILSDSKELKAGDFAALDPEMHQQHMKSLESEGKTLDEVEKSVIEKTLVTHQGNISKAAKELGLTRTSLYRRIEKYGL
ncbi:MAG: sigma-54-dependent Fis family transcriptional regulator [Proteobacteria bacterium]|nr:sigma-54-dependent Fis family transcriptional regulator [Pseudomonadota bacterium]